MSGHFGTGAEVSRAGPKCPVAEVSGKRRDFRLTDVEAETEDHEDEHRKQSTNHVHRSRQPLRHCDVISYLAPELSRDQSDIQSIILYNGRVTRRSYAAVSVYGDTE